MNAWLPQASYPCGNFSDTSSLKFRGTKGSIGHISWFVFTLKIKIKGAFTLLFYTRFLFSLSSPLGHLRYLLTDVPPQPNSPPDNVFNLDRLRKATLMLEEGK